MDEEFVATHTIKGDPVMLVKGAGGPPYFVDADGKRRAPSAKNAAVPLAEYAMEGEEKPPTTMEIPAEALRTALTAWRHPGGYCEGDGAIANRVSDTRVQLSLPAGPGLGGHKRYLIEVPQLFRVVVVETK